MTVSKWRRIVPWLVILELGMSGAVLGAISPILLFIGGWGGADSGSVWQGILSVLGVPWLIYAVCAARAVALLLRHYALLACVPASVPLILEAWAYAGLVHR